MDIGADVLRPQSREGIGAEGIRPYPAPFNAAIAAGISAEP